MAKQSIRYICRNCGATTLKYSGKCYECNSWGTLEETVTEPAGGSGTSVQAPTPENLHEGRASEPAVRHSTGMGELDRVLGGGLMPSSAVLIGGEPGIGKSTLMLHLAPSCSPLKTLYICGEESPSQVRSRAARLGINAPHLWLLPEVNLERALASIDREKPGLVIVDSIQSMMSEGYRSAAGTMTQIRESASGLVRAAKENGFILLIIGHITKEGSLAGPKTLEHMVDTVLQFEGESHQRYRMIRAVKNRFGPANEIGVFRMDEEGLEEVTNPSEFFIADRSTDVPGNSVHASLEGTRALLVEIQALVSKTGYSMPQRISSGFDLKRLNIILAILEKRLQLPTWGQDVFVKVAGGLKLGEPAADLGVACAIASALGNRPTDPLTVSAAEIGLSGELRAISDSERRIRETAHLGFKKILLPAANTRELKPSVKKLPLNIIGCATLRDALEHLGLV
ncbi:DNA repair protein RadA [Prosthecochloris sp. N3]|uniref:DNA repair protein RadA n=1 Tax=Prosthecochloris ethylica TaxID=2743976 RepID=A0ABR9XSX0_9CHLB|nr:DNA repair protein RadA [Prosthecochloris ethylica]MBF0586971.1 DNA repair protein RadA [Prosthecochloris ethylica]MBF0637152.1 DNA repair protein RadA [Prosthecochloris ethylica]MEC9486689.1 DNA repair protein RadA [Prosthecochloris sp.]NUK48160.1 DNA repair protein RadA [Prosthecochloris ethylica]